jgi:hypothetical protein
MRLIPAPIPKRVPSKVVTTPFGTGNAAGGNTVRPRVLPAIVPQTTALATEHFSAAGLPQWAQNWAGSLTRLQRKIAAALQAVKQAHDANEQVIPGQAFTGGTALVLAHNLGTTPTGYRLENFQGAGAVYFGSYNGQTISVTCATTCTADVVVWA